jgi:hypothetical protein
MGNGYTWHITQQYKISLMQIMLSSKVKNLVVLEQISNCTLKWNRIINILLTLLMLKSMISFSIATPYQRVNLSLDIEDMTSSCHLLQGGYSQIVNNLLNAIHGHPHIICSLRIPQKILTSCATSPKMTFEKYYHDNRPVTSWKRWYLDWRGIVFGETGIFLE